MLFPTDNLLRHLDEAEAPDSKGPPRPFRKAGDKGHQSSYQSTYILAYPDQFVNGQGLE